MPQSTTIYTHANVYTGATGATPARAEAFAVRDGKILAVGSEADVSRAAGADAQRVDLHGSFVMPGFNDAHVHFGEAANIKMHVDLVGTKSLAEMQQRIAEATKNAAPDDWIVGGGWDHTKWQSQTTPTKADIDKVTAGHPAVFVRVDGHISVVSSEALARGGVTRDTRDPQGGKIDRDSHGEPTGILRETARGLVESKIPMPSMERRRAGIELVLKGAAKVGITSAQDFSSHEDFLVYEQLEKEGKLTLRISEWLPIDLTVAQLNALRNAHDPKDPMLHTGMLKGFMDGSLGSRTAAMLAPYSDDPKNSGIPRYSQAELNLKTLERARAGFQIGFHAIGDRGVQMALNALQYAEKTIGKREYRFRIEHAQVVAPADFQRFKDLGIIASMQPNHVLTDMNWAMARLGEDRARNSYAWKHFLDIGVPLAFGTDYPVEPVTPFRGIYAAITRQNEDQTKSYFPEDKITIEQALAAYTTGSAYAQYDEHTKGTLAPGMLADFVVLDRDLTKIPPPDILKTRVLRTVVGGKTVYEAAP